MSKISLEPKKEKELIQKAQKGKNKEAFGELYKHYHPHILRFYKYRLKDEALCEDLTSEVFEKALKALDSFQWQGVSFSAWLYRIARNLLIDYYRSVKLKRKIPLEDIQHKTFSSTHLPEASLQIIEIEDQINSLLQILSKRERTIIYMKFFEGYTNKNIADKLNLSETNVGTILYRVIRKLKKEILTTDAGP